MDATFLVSDVVEPDNARLPLLFSLKATKR
jgi:hypothetical protein